MSSPLNGHSRRPAPRVHEGVLVKPLMRLSLVSTLRSRRFVVAALVGVIPLLLGAALIAADAENDHRSERFEPTLADPVAYVILGGTVPFMAMLLAGSIVADEVEDRTLSYILVRPLRRRQLYLSRLVPAAGIAVALAVAQVVAFTLLRLLSFALYGTPQVSFVRSGVQHTVDTLDLMLAQAGLAVLAAALAAVAFLALFAFVTVLTTKYHFIANILVLANVELLFGNLGGRGAGVVTVTYHAQSLLHAVGPLDPSYYAAAWWVAIPALLAIAAVWTWAATWRMGRRDFNVTSAAS